MKNRFNLKTTDGSFSIEAVLAMANVLIIFMMIIGFYTFINPYTILNRDVHALATLAQRQGGLTDEDVEQFKERLNAYGFVDPQKGDIEVYAQTINEVEAIGIDGFGEAGTNYIKRDSKDFIVLAVSVPSYGDYLTSVFRVMGMGGQKAPDRYLFKETFLSERN